MRVVQFVLWIIKNGNSLWVLNSLWCMSRWKSSWVTFPQKRGFKHKKWNRPPAGGTARDPPLSLKIHRVMIPWPTPHPEPAACLPLEPKSKKQDEKPQRLNVPASMAKREPPFPSLQHITQMLHLRAYMKKCYLLFCFVFLEKMCLKPTQTATARGWESSEDGTAPGWEDAASSASSSERCVSSQSEPGQLLFHKPLACMQVHLLQEFSS